MGYGSDNEEEHCSSKDASLGVVAHCSVLCSSLLYVAACLSSCSTPQLWHALLTPPAQPRPAQSCSSRT